MATVTAKQPSRRGSSKKVTLTAMDAACAKKAKIVSGQIQRRIFDGDTIELGDSIGTCLDIEFPEWTPLFAIGGIPYGSKKSKKD